MKMPSHLIQAATLVAAAVLCALVSNAFASRDRQMKLVGFYPNAQKVPARETAVAPAPVAPAPAPVTSSQLPVATTTTVAPPPTATQQPSNPATTSTTQKPNNPTPPPQPRNPATPDLSKFKPHENTAYIEIAYPDVKTLHDAGVLFLDARRTSVYEQGHIAGARPYSVWESDIDDKVKKFFDERQDPAQQALPIVVYCSGGDCEDSHMLARKLFGALFNNVYVYKDGFPDWEKHGGAVHRGSEP